MSRSGIVACGKTRLALCALPNDVLLKIIGALDARSAITFGRVCKALHQFAASRPAWLAIARAVARTSVLPLPLHNSYPTPASLSTPDMKAAVRRAIQTERVFGRASPAIHVHPRLHGISGLYSGSCSYSLLSDQTVVYSALLPGARFLLTVQTDGSFACWDLAFPIRTRCVRLQTGSDANAYERVEPRCVAYWKTGAPYVEFVHDVAQDGDVVIVALLVVSVVPDQLTPSRDLHVLRIALPSLHSQMKPRPAIPDESMYNIQLLASASIPHPLFVCSSYVHASGHAGLVGNAGEIGGIGSEVVFVLFFEPHPSPSVVALPTTSTLTQALDAATLQTSSRVAYIQCNFQTKPTRSSALGSADHIMLYCESGGYVYSYAHNANAIRAQAFARSSSLDPLIVPSPPPHEDPFPEEQHGTPGAPHIQRMCAVLRKSAPAWLEYGEDWNERLVQRDKALQAELLQGAPGTGVDRISAMSMTIDAETTNLDAFRGLVIGVHNIDAGRKSTSLVAPPLDVHMAEAPSARPDHVQDPRPSSSLPLTPIRLSPPVPNTASLESPPPPQPPRYRRTCRVRYKRTIFPSRLTCTWHELATLGTFGHQAIWIEGDGPPPEEDGTTAVPPPAIPPELLRDESASLRVMLMPVDGGEPKEVTIPSDIRRQLGRVSCVTMDDSVGVLAMATLDGRVILLEFV